MLANNRNAPIAVKASSSSDASSARIGAASVGEMFSHGFSRKSRFHRDKLGGDQREDSDSPFFRGAKGDNRKAFFSGKAMSNWYYRNPKGRTQGPVPSSLLLELIRSGEIDGETEVRKEDSQWVLACQVNGLWQAAGKPGVAFKCSFCQAEIDRPPTKCKSCDKWVEKAVGQLVQHTLPVSKSESWTKPTPLAEKPKSPPLQ